VVPNERPRDRLGRPLPYGSVGVEPEPEVAGRSPVESLERAQYLLDQGRPFAAHEVLESAWKAAPENERELWRGLAQLAVGLTHLQRGNLVGARSLLRRGADCIAGYTDFAPYRIDVEGLLAWAARRAEDADDADDSQPPPRLTVEDPTHSPLM
jgi:hypothetical protein